MNVNWEVVPLVHAGGKKAEMVKNWEISRMCRCQNILANTLLWSLTSSGFSDGSVGKEFARSAGDRADPGSIPGREDPLEKGTETHSSLLAWEIPWTEEPGGLWSIQLQRVGQKSLVVYTITKSRTSTAQHNVTHCAAGSRRYLGNKEACKSPNSYYQCWQWHWIVPISPPGFSKKTNGSFLLIFHMCILITISVPSVSS